MIRVECAVLPTGLRAVAHRDAAGLVVIYYAAWLTAYERKLAIREARAAVGGRSGGHSGGLPTAGAMWGTAAIIAIVAVAAAFLAFSPSARPQRARPAGSVSVAPARHHHRRRPYPDPRPEYVR